MFFCLLEEIGVKRINYFCFASEYAILSMESSKFPESDYSWKWKLDLKFSFHFRKKMLLSGWRELDYSYVLYSNLRRKLVNANVAPDKRVPSHKENGGY